MERTTNLHDTIAHARLSQATGVMDNPAALDAAVDMLHAHAAARDTAIRRFLRAREVPASWLSGRHDDLHLVERERQEAQILEQATPRGQGIRGRIGHPVIVGAAGIGVTQKKNRERRIDQQDVFDRVAIFLAAITARLLSRILGTLDAPFGPIVAKRGEVGADGSTGVGGSVVGTTSALASASAIPRRFPSSIKDRVGASPRRHSVACRTTNKT
jgi:hypothetical protein